MIKYKSDEGDSSGDLNDVAAFTSWIEDDPMFDAEASFISHLAVSTLYIAHLGEFILPMTVL